PSFPTRRASDLQPADRAPGSRRSYLFEGSMEGGRGGPDMAIRQGAAARSGMMIVLVPHPGALFLPACQPVIVLPEPVEEVDRAGQRQQENQTFGHGGSPAAYTAGWGYSCEY